MTFYRATVLDRKEGRKGPKSGPFRLFCTTFVSSLTLTSFTKGIPFGSATIMADLDDFFAKKDKKKKGKSGFSKANTDVLKTNLEENERKSEQKNLEDSKAAQLKTSEAARASMAGEDPAKAKDKEAAATPGGGGEGGGGAKGSAVSGVGSAGGMKSNYSSYGSGGEIVLATTDAARKANMMIGLGDDGTVTKEI